MPERTVVSRREKMVDACAYWLNDARNAMDVFAVRPSVTGKPEG